KRMWAVGERNCGRNAPEKRTRAFANALAFQAIIRGICPAGCPRKKSYRRIRTAYEVERVVPNALGGTCSKSSNFQHPSSSEAPTFSGKATSISDGADALAVHGGFLSIRAS